MKSEIIVNENKSHCCGETRCCKGIDYIISNEKHIDLLPNVNENLSLGCEIPTSFAQIKLGDTIVNLGSGIGNNCFVARAMVGDTGKIIGVDFTQKIDENANHNISKLDFTNVEFRLGDFDVNRSNFEISNCNLKLVTDNEKAFAEIYEILKAGGNMSVIDIILPYEVEAKLKNITKIYTGIVKEEIQIKKYLVIIEQAVFQNIEVEKEKLITITDKIMLEYLTKLEFNEFEKYDVGIVSISVFSEKLNN